MLNNFIYAKTKTLFTTELEAGNILDEAIVFIEDTKEIWNHGTYFNCSISSEDIDDVVDDIESDTFLRYVAQALTDEQKTQARENIGAVSADYVDQLILTALNTEV